MRYFHGVEIVPDMRFLLIICNLLLSFTLFSQKMLPSGEWCAAGRKTGKLPPPSTADTRSDSIDILHTDITLNLLDPPQLSARCRIRFRPKASGVPEIRLDLQGLMVDSVALNGAKLPFSHDGVSLRVPFPLPLPAGDTAQLTIDYHGQPPTDAGNWGGVYDQSGYIFNIGVGFAADPHSFGRAWFPCFDNFRERCSFDFSVTAPTGKPAYCNGIFLGETEQTGQLTRHWTIGQPIPSYLACFAAGPYVTWKRNYDAIPVEIAAAAADTNKVAATFQHLPQALQCFQYWYGPYQWPKIGYSLVPFNSGAMEHATNVAIGRVFIDGTLNYETLWAHELSHHWWGDLATCSTAEDMWLNEGWAVYSEHLFTEWLYGREAYKEAVSSNFLNVLEKTHVAEGGYRAVSGVPHHLTYGEHVYNKGAVVAHNLRGYLGDSLFHTGITAALTETSFDDWSSAELRDKLSAATGQDLTDFFEDWVFNPGFSHFSIDSVQYLTGTDSLILVKIFIRQKLRGAPHFFQKVPLEFSLVNDKWERLERTAPISGEHQEVEIFVPAQFNPKFVWVNANLRLTLARADREMVVKTTGNKNFTPAKMTMTVNILPDSALIRAEHHYAMPDTGGTANPLAYRLSNRYWTVEGDWPAGLDATATVFYDGRGQMDQLDTELFAQTGPNEDSILLLYRPGPGYPWQEYPDYSKNKLSSSTDRYGFFRINHLQRGQYAVAKGAATVGAAEPGSPTPFITASPNPANETIRLSASESFSKILILSEKGEFVRNWNVAPVHSVEISAKGLVSGAYQIVALTGKGPASCRVIIIK